ATASDAEAWVTNQGAKLLSRGKKQKASQWQSFGFEYDKSLQNPEMWGQKLDEVFTNNGGILFGQRTGARLGNLSRDLGGVDVDPIQSLLDGWRVATNHVTKGELISNMRQRLHNFLQQHHN